MKKFLLASAAAIAFASGAQAADLGVARVPVAAAVIAPAGFSWTGFYLGAHIGYGWGNTRFDSALTDLFTNNGIASPNHNTSGMVLGGQFGWNYQVNQFVFGLEASLAWANLNGSRNYVDYNGVGSGTLGVNTRMNWVATMGPRLGFAIDRALIYGKGGFAAAGFNSGLSVSGSRQGASDFDGRGSFARGGWFLGAGVEYAFAPNWSAKLEYNYLDFGRGNWNAAQIPLGQTAISIGTPARLTAHTVTLGVNYLFTTGPSAVVARY